MPMPGKVLVVDDSAVSRQLLKRVLRRKGHVVFTASDGIDASRALERHAIDVVITDLQMASLDGHGLIQEVRKRPSFRDVAFIIFTGDDHPESLERARRSGAVDVVVKGTDMNHLVGLVDRIASEGRVSCPPAAKHGPSIAPHPVDAQTRDDDEAGRRLPARLFTELAQRRVGLPEQRVLDVGTGMGALARGLSAKGADVTAVDKRDDRFERARALDRANAVHVQYEMARAEQLPFGVDTFDALTTRHCFTRFDQRRACREFVRVLRPGGVFALVQNGCVALAHNVVKVTADYMARAGSAFLLGTGSGLNPDWLEPLHEAGFTALETFSFDHAVSFGSSGWANYTLRHSVHGATDPESLGTGLKAHLAEHFGEGPLHIHRRTWAVIAKSPS